MIVFILILFSSCLTYFISLSDVVIFVNNMKHLSSVITINLLQNSYTPIQIDNYKLLYFSCWFRGKSALSLLNEKVKVIKSCVKKHMDFTNCGSKIVGSSQFLLSKSLCNNWHNIILT